MKFDKRLERYNFLHLPFLCEQVDQPELTADSILRQKAEPVDLNVTSDKNDILRFWNAFTCLETRTNKSLAAPQVGLAKQMIIFSVPIGRQIHQPFPKSFWINPTYEMVNDEQEEEFELCPSVDMVVPVKRYRRIIYSGHDLITRQDMKGEAQGKTARVIQHEIDHLNGILISDLAPRDTFITMQEYRQRLKDRWEGKGWEHWIDVLQQEIKDLRAAYPALPKPKPPKGKLKLKKGQKKKIVKKTYVKPLSFDEKAIAELREEQKAYREKHNLW